MLPGVLVWSPSRINALLRCLVVGLLTLELYRRKHKRLHEGGVLGPGLAGDGALARIDAGWRELAGRASVARLRQR